MIERSILVIFFWLVMGVSFVCADVSGQEAEARAGVVKAILAPENQQSALVEKLSAVPHPVLAEILEGWQKEQIFILETGAGERTPVLCSKDTANGAVLLRVDNGEVLRGEKGEVLGVKAGEKPVETTSKSRRAMKAVTDSLALGDPVPEVRENAIFKLGMKQNVESLPLLERLMVNEKDEKVRKAIENAVAFVRLKSPDTGMRVEGLKHLAKSSAIFSQDFVKRMVEEPSQPKEVMEAGRKTLLAIERKIFFTDFYGTIFRGVSLGSVLLVVALGLAITFGLMGVINMAHGEVMMVGGYATFVVQCIFGAGLAMAPFGFSLQIPGMGLDSGSVLYQSYFLVALPVAFFAGAGAGFLLEKSVIQFLYRRPLESLLATWGVSLVMQQLFRLVFGPANVPVASPAWLTGSLAIEGVIMNYNRIFVIVFAVLIVVGTSLLLSKTPLGLLIRAVMQDRTMAACMGVRTRRVNTLTFAFGSGLAGLAGAFLSQIGNIGPSTGQTYIVDAFMVVVLGGVGNLIGTVISALGIGTVDQVLQTFLRNPVIGKVLVLVGIILFLQWKPSGLFATKSRGLEEGN